MILPGRTNRYTVTFTALVLLAMVFVLFKLHPNKKEGMVVFFLPKGSVVVNQTTGHSLSPVVAPITKNPSLKEATFSTRLAYGNHRFLVREPSGEEHTVVFELNSPTLAFHLAGGEIRRLR